MIILTSSDFSLFGLFSLSKITLVHCKFYNIHQHYTSCDKHSNGFNSKSFRRSHSHFLLWNFQGLMVILEKELYIIPRAQKTKMIIFRSRSRRIVVFDVVRSIHFSKHFALRPADSKYPDRRYHFDCAADSVDGDSMYLNT